MADIIQVLPDRVANQIAAGEVVQRPASVVKELLENAIDAQAIQIRLIVKNAGKTLIQVIDNGSGMSETDARLSFERHATSKIKKAEDLFNITSKGFRGEALASIAAVAHVELKTKLEQKDLGTHIVIKGSEVISQQPTSTQKGTSITVKNLFFNVPARRNFLKSDSVEMRHIIDEFNRTALAHPTIKFLFFHNGNELFNLPSATIRQRIVNIFGTKSNEKWVPINENTEVVKLSGFVGKPEFAKKTRPEQFFFVNHRFIKSAYLNHAVQSAFEGLLRPKTKASYFLYLEVNAKTIDINIHPTKTEIKFEDEHTIYAVLRAAVKHSLGQFNIAPVLDFNTKQNLDLPYHYKEKTISNPSIEVDKTFNPFIEKQSKATHTSSYKKAFTSQWESLYVGLETEEFDYSKEHLKTSKLEQDVDDLKLIDDDTLETSLSTIQIQNRYILSPLKSGLLVIDQHRAHLRILYESFLEQITIKKATSQQLLFALKLSFSKPELTILKTVKDQLEQLGFVFSSWNDGDIHLQGIPTQMDSEQVNIIFEKLISDIQNEVPENHFSTTDLLAKSLAESMAIKAGKLLKKEEHVYIINQLFACKDPSVSIDNKRIFFTVKTEDLDKKFNKI